MKLSKARIQLWLKKHACMLPGYVVMMAGIVTLVAAILCIITVFLWNSDPANPFGVYISAPEGATLDEAIDLAAESGILKDWLPREMLFLHHRYLFTLLGVAEIALGCWLKNLAVRHFRLEEIFLDE